MQAREALSLGLRKNPHQWGHVFQDYQMDYVVQQCLSCYTPRDLCPEGLERLLSHDEENPDMELAKTLETYYNCKLNASEAAKRLFIHRTTLFYRLNRIRELAGIDFDNPDERLHIMLCFALLKDEEARLA